jgi:archaellum biogenesis ATPase FlaH
MLNFVENLLENERGPMNDQDLTKTDYDPDRSLVLIDGLSHFLTNFLQNLALCQTSFRVIYPFMLSLVTLSSVNVYVVIFLIHNYVVASQNENYFGAGLTSLTDIRIKRTNANITFTLFTRISNGSIAVSHG